MKLCSNNQYTTAPLILFFKNTFIQFMKLKETKKRFIENFPNQTVNYQNQKRFTEIEEKFPRKLIRFRFA